MAQLSKWIVQGTVTLILLILASMSSGTKVNDGHPDSTTRWLFRRLGEEPQLLRPLTELAEQQKGSPLIDINLGADNSTLCLGCLAAVTGLKAVLSLTNHTYESLRPVLIPICEQILAGGEIICEGILDNYGPHVAYIMDKTNKLTSFKTPKQICELMNHCDVSIEPPSNTFIPETSAKSAQHTRSNAGFNSHPGLDVMKHILTSQPDAEDHQGGSRNEHARIRQQTKRKEDALRVLQVADFHIDEKYTEGAAVDCEFIVCCRKDFNGTGSAGHWGDYKCNIPPRTINMFLEFAAEELKPGLVIYSGDNPPHSAWEESYASQLNSTRLAASLVTAQMIDKMGVLSYPTLGNHDTMPTNLYSMDKAIHGEHMKEFNQGWTEAWAKAANFTNDQATTILKAGYYTILAKPGLRIVCINSNYGYIDNFYNIIQLGILGKEYKAMKSWLEKTLEAARNAEEKVIMISHHDIGVNVIEFDEWFTNTLAAYKDIIVFHPVGHVHRDEFRMYFDEKEPNQPAGMVYVSMTMNPWPHVNPGFRLYYLDKDTYEVLDYDQYFMNLTEATNDSRPTKLYTFTEEYSLPDATPKSHMELWQRLRKDRDLMRNYMLTKRLRTGYGGPCDEACEVAELCHQVSQTYERYLTCMTYYADDILVKPASSTTTTEPTTTTSPVDSSISLIANHSLIYLLLFAVVYLLKV